ncbi:Ankyrin repeat protein, partial [Giardia duodenalis]
VGRAEGSCSNLLRSIFSVYFQLRNKQYGSYHKLKLFVAVRRCNGKGEEKMKEKLCVNIQNIYKRSVPSEFREKFDNFINLDFWFIWDKEHRSDEYMHQVEGIRTQLLRLAAEAVQQPASSGRLPLTLAESPETYETLWGRLCSNEGLDFLSMQKAMGTEIAERCIEKFDAGLASLDLPVPATPQKILAAKLDPMRFVQSCADAASGVALSFDEQTEGYLDRPRAQQREILHRQIKSRLEDKAARVARSISSAAVGIMSNVSQETEQLLSDWDGERLLIAPDSAAVTLAGAVEELDAVYASHRDGPLLRVPGLFYDLGFFHNRFVEEMDLLQQPSGEGVYGSLSSLHASLLSWCVKLSAPLGVLCEVRETVTEACGTLGSLLDKTRQAMQEAAERAGLAHLQCTGARVRSALSDTSSSPQTVLAALYNDLIGESQTRVRRAAEALGWKDFPADGVLPRTREALLTLVQREMEQSLRRDAVEVPAQAMDAAFVHDGAELRSYESEDSVAARYSEVREGLETYMRSLGIVRLEGREISVPGEQIDEVLKRADDEWGKMHSNVRDGLRTRQENQKLREMHDQASTELNRQREQIKALEESARQQRDEAEKRQKELDAALKAVNNEIASLKKELTISSAKVDTLEQQIADTVKHLARMNRLTPIKDPSWTDLMRAAANGNIEAVKRHLADKDKKNSDGNTALVFAARAGQGAMLELLDPTDCNGVTALMRAASNSNVEAVRALIPLQKGKEMMGDARINGLRISSGTALMMAAAHGHAECIKLLLNREAGMQDEDGYTALMSAVINNDLECAGLLAKREGHIKRTYERCNDGYPSPQTCTETALDIAKANRCKAIIAILSEGIQ